MYLLKAWASYFPFHFPRIMYTQFTSVAIILKAIIVYRRRIMDNTIMTPASVTEAQKTQIEKSNTVVPA